MKPYAALCVFTIVDVEVGFYTKFKEKKGWRESNRVNLMGVCEKAAGMREYAAQVREKAAVAPEWWRFGCR